MAINPLLSAVSAALAQQSAPAPVRPATIPATDDSISGSSGPGDSLPSQSVVQNASLLNASTNFAQLSSLLEVAQAGTEQVGTILQQLQGLAEQATGGGDVSGLDSEFQQLLSEIDQTVSGTTFGGTPLLDGTLSGNTNNQATSLSLPDLSIAGLFGGTPPDISTPQDAAAALASLTQAQGTVDATGTSIDNTFAQLSFAAASVDSALANSGASTSTLSDGDLANGAVSDIFAGLLGQPAQATQAQSGNLTSLLSLLQE